jgi:hypothetical protein
MILSRARGSMTNINGFWIGWLDLFALLLQSLLITINYDSLQSMTVCDSLHSLLGYECLPFHCDWLGSDLRIGHFFSFHCPLVNTPQLNTQLSSLLWRPVVAHLRMTNLLWLNSLTNQSCVTFHNFRRTKQRSSPITIPLSLHSLSWKCA